MKQFMISVLVIAGWMLVSATATQTGYNNGWEDGWCEGYREVIENQWAICPIAPISPVPPVGRDNYKGGFALGYKASIKHYNQ